MQQLTQGIVFALISTASWALCTMIFKKLGEKLDPIGMTFVKSALSVVFLFFLVLILGQNILIPYNLLIPIFFSAIIGIVIGDTLFFASLNKLSPFVLSIILFVGPDIFTGIFGLLFLGEMPKLIVWIGIILVLVGLGFFVVPLQKDAEVNATKTTFGGIILAILSLICTAYSMVLIKPVLIQISVITSLMYRMMFSAIALFLFGFFSKKILFWNQTLSDKKYSLKLFLTVFIVTFGGFFCSLLAIKYCDLVVASTLMSLEPLFIMLFMLLFCKYKPERKEYIGLVICIVGIMLIFRG